MRNWKHLYQDLTNPILTCLVIMTIFSAFKPLSIYASETESKLSNIAFTSDIHGKTNNLKTWLCSLTSGGCKKLDYMVFGGDYADSFDSTMFSKIDDVVSAQYPGTDSIYTIGNHEWKGLEKESTFQATTGCSRTGVQVKEKDYIIYTLGAASITQEFTENDIKALDYYLSSTDNSIPIFVVAHYPLHTYTSGKKFRVTANAKELIGVLNKYPNVIYLWGHNHTLKDKNYCAIKCCGDNIEYSNGNTIAIKFTYASMGCMKDGACQSAYGLIATVRTNDAGYKVKLQYRNKKKVIGKAVTINSQNK